MEKKQTISPKDFEGKNARERIPYKATPYKRWKIPGTPRAVTKTQKLLVYLTVVVIFIYLLWRAIFTIPFQYGVASIIMSFLFLFAEILTFIIAFSNFREALQYEDPALPEIPEEWYPDVDLFIATHNETVELMYKTVNACTFLDYPDKSKVHIWVCDDTNRPEMKKMAEELGVGYFGLENNTHAKAGNMNNGFWQTSSELVVTIDADMILKSEFLMETVPYFFYPRVELTEEGHWRILEEEEIDPEYKVGFVQTPQSFYNPDLFQYNLYSERNVPNEQDYFFTEVNVAKNADNIAQYAGSNTVISRKALEEVGGFATESITEDLLTGLMILQAGYRNFGISKQLAHGLCPDTIGSLLGQRERWSRGNVQVLKTLKIFTSNTLDFWQKFELIAMLCYWLSFIGQTIAMVAPILSALFNVRVLDAPIWQIAAIWLPYYLLFFFSSRLFAGATRTNHWSSVVDTIMAPYLTLPTLKEVFGITQKKFVVTKKSKDSNVQQWRKIVYAVPHAFLLIACLFAIFLIIRQSININSLYNPVVLFWLLVQGKNLLFSLFFMLGRTNYRQAERFDIQTDVSLQSYGITYKGTTSDASDTGMGVVFDTPLNIRSDTLVGITVWTEAYKATMQCKIVNVQQERNGAHWKYGFVIEEIDEHNWRQYLQLLYDRPHSLPKRFKANASVFDDINTNLMRRTRRKERNVRKMPRITMDLPFATADGHKGMLYDLNFEFARVDFDKELAPDETLTLDFGEGVTLVLMPNIVSANGGFLYRIVNSDEILERPDFDEIMEQWQNIETDNTLAELLVGYVNTKLSESKQSENSREDTQQ